MQQKIRRVKEPIVSALTIPGSKTMTHRAIFLAALADGISEISGMQTGPQTLALLNALHQFGIATQFDQSAQSCIIAGCSGKFPKKTAAICLHQANTLMHFLLAASAQTPGHFIFDGSKGLRQLSFAPLLRILSLQGAEIIPYHSGQLPFALAGADSLEGGEITFEQKTNVATMSALFMVAPFARSTFQFNMPSRFHSYYLDITCNMMAEFDVLVKRVHQSQYIIPVPQRYAAHDYTIEPDLALATYFFAAAAVTNGSISIQPIKRYLSKQREIVLLSLLEAMGCEIHETHRNLNVKGPAVLQGIEAKLADFNDGFAALAAIAPFAKSPTLLAHRGKITKQESRRLLLIKNELNKLGILVENGCDWLKIFPGTPRSGVVDSHGDRRIAMAFCLIGLKVEGVSINNTACVTKVYPHFFTQWDKLSENAHAHAS